MQTMLLLPVLAAGLAQVALAETYDILTFNPPSGFRRLTTEDGTLAYDDSVSHDGRPTELCQIVLFPSKATNSSPLENFQAEWEEKIIRRQAGTTRPQAMMSRVGADWTAMSATADIVLGDRRLHHLLIATSGHGRVMSIEILAAGGAHQAQIQDFIRSLKFRPGPGGVGQADRGQTSLNLNPGAPPDPGAPAVSGSTGGPVSYIYAAPPGWTHQETRTGIVVSSPVYSNGERCTINMLPLRPAGRSLPDDTMNIYRQTFRFDPLQNYPSPQGQLLHGVSPQGWEYFIIKKDIGEEGNSRTLGTIVMGAKVGSQMAVIIATSKDFLISNCLGLSIRDSWPVFFYSLRFQNAPPATDQKTAIAQRLAGEWMMATGGVGLTYTFHADGRYLSGGAAQQRYLVGPNEVLTTTQGYFGDGSYSFDGNRIVLAGDDGRRFTKSFRVGEESKDGRTWTGQMCMLDDGASGEVCYRKQR
jgi:hypothetical protein